MRDLSYQKRVVFIIVEKKILYNESVFYLDFI